MPVSRRMSERNVFSATERSSALTGTAPSPAATRLPLKPYERERPAQGKHVWSLHRKCPSRQSHGRNGRRGR